MMTPKLLLGFILAATTLSATVFNVRDYGAKGDGTTLDSPAINDAISAAGTAGGGTVVLPAGTYLGVGVMGALSALIVSACVAPPLIAALMMPASSLTVVLGIWLGRTFAHPDAHAETRSTRRSTARGQSPPWRAIPRAPLRGLRDSA